MNVSTYFCHMGSTRRLGISFIHWSKFGSSVQVCTFYTLFHSSNVRYINPEGNSFVVVVHWYCRYYVIQSASSLDQTQFLNKLAYLHGLVTSSCLTALLTGLEIFSSPLNCFVHVPALSFSFGGFSVIGVCIKALSGKQSYKSPFLFC